jgi:hypothetical protein
MQEEEEEEVMMILCAGRECSPASTYVLLISLLQITTVTKFALILRIK